MGIDTTWMDTVESLRGDDGEGISASEQEKLLLDEKNKRDLENERRENRLLAQAKYDRKLEIAQEEYDAEEETRYNPKDLFRFVEDSMNNNRIIYQNYRDSLAEDEEVDGWVRAGMYGKAFDLTAGTASYSDKSQLIKENYISERIKNSKVDSRDYWGGIGNNTINQVYDDEWKMPLRYNFVDYYSNQFSPFYGKDASAVSVGMSEVGDIFESPWGPLNSLMGIGDYFDQVGNPGYMLWQNTMEQWKDEGVPGELEQRELMQAVYALDYDYRQETDSSFGRGADSFLNELTLGYKAPYIDMIESRSQDDEFAKTMGSFAGFAVSFIGPQALASGAVKAGSKLAVKGLMKKGLGMSFKNSLKAPVTMNMAGQAIHQTRPGLIKLADWYTKSKGGQVLNQYFTNALAFNIHGQAYNHPDGRTLWGTMKEMGHSSMMAAAFTGIGSLGRFAENTAWGKAGGYKKAKAAEYPLAFGMGYALTPDDPDNPLDNTNKWVNGLFLMGLHGYAHKKQVDFTRKGINQVVRYIYKHGLNMEKVMKRGYVEFPLEGGKTKENPSGTKKYTLEELGIPKDAISIKNEEGGMIYHRDFFERVKDKDSPNYGKRYIQLMAEKIANELANAPSSVHSAIRTYGKLYYATKHFTPKEFKEWRHQQKKEAYNHYARQTSNPITESVKTVKFEDLPTFGSKSSVIEHPEFSRVESLINKLSKNPSKSSVEVAQAALTSMLDEAAGGYLLDSSSGERVPITEPQLDELQTKVNPFQTKINDIVTSDKKVPIKEKDGVTTLHTDAKGPIVTTETSKSGAMEVKIRDDIVKDYLEGNKEERHLISQNLYAQAPDNLKADVIRKLHDLGEGKEKTIHREFEEKDEIRLGDGPINPRTNKVLKQFSEPITTKKEAVKRVGAIEKFIIKKTNDLAKHKEGSKMYNEIITQIYEAGEYGQNLENVLADKYDVAPGGTSPPVRTTDKIGYRAGKPNQVSEGIDTMPHGTGHYGTGVYFFGSKEQAVDYDSKAVGGEGVSEIDLTGKKMYTPKAYTHPTAEGEHGPLTISQSEAGIELHDILQSVNRASNEFANGEEVMLDFEGTANELNAMGIKVTPHEIKEAVVNAGYNIEQYGRGLGEKSIDQVDIDTASTRLMKGAGYDGIDVRGIEGLDNAAIGSVLYKQSAGPPLDTNFKKLSAIDRANIADGLTDYFRTDKEIDTSLEVGFLGLTPQNLKIVAQALVDTGRFLFSDLPKNVQKQLISMGINKDNFSSLLKNFANAPKKLQAMVKKIFPLLKQFHYKKGGIPILRKRYHDLRRTVERRGSDIDPKELQKYVTARNKLAHAIEDFLVKTGAVDKKFLQRDKKIILDTHSLGDIMKKDKTTGNIIDKEADVKIQVYIKNLRKYENIKRSLEGESLNLTEASGYPVNRKGTSDLIREMDGDNPFSPVVDNYQGHELSDPDLIEDSKHPHPVKPAEQPSAIGNLLRRLNNTEGIMDTHTQKTGIPLHYYHEQVVHHYNILQNKNQEELQPLFKVLVEDFGVGQGQDGTLKIGQDRLQLIQAVGQGKATIDQLEPREVRLLTAIKDILNKPDSIEQFKSNRFDHWKETGSKPKGVKKGVMENLDFILETKGIAEFRKELAKTKGLIIEKNYMPNLADILSVEGMSSEYNPNLEMSTSKGSTKSRENLEGKEGNALDNIVRWVRAKNTLYYLDPSVRIFRDLVRSGILPKYIENDVKNYTKEIYERPEMSNDYVLNFLNKATGMLLKSAFVGPELLIRNLNQILTTLPYLGWKGQIKFLANMFKNRMTRGALDITKSASFKAHDKESQENFLNNVSMNRPLTEEFMRMGNHKLLSKMGPVGNAMIRFMGLYPLTDLSNRWNVYDPIYKMVLKDIEHAHKEGLTFDQRAGGFEDGKSLKHSIKWDIVGQYKSLQDMLRPVIDKALKGDKKAQRFLAMRIASHFAGPVVNWNYHKLGRTGFEWGNKYNKVFMRLMTYPWSLARQIMYDTHRAWEGARDKDSRKFWSGMTPVLGRMAVMYGIEHFILSNIFGDKNEDEEYGWGYRFPDSLMGQPGTMITQHLRILDDAFQIIKNGEPVKDFAKTLDRISRTYVPFVKIGLRQLETIHGVNRIKPFTDAYDVWMDNEYSSYDRREVEFNAWQHMLGGGGFYGEDYYYYWNRKGERKRKKRPGFSGKKSSRNSGGRKQSNKYSPNKRVRFGQ